MTACEDCFYLYKSSDGESICYNPRLAYVYKSKIFNPRVGSATSHNCYKRIEKYIIRGCYFVGNNSQQADELRKTGKF